VPRRPLDLTGQVVAVTGGGRGIGAAIGRAAARAGARVALGDIDAHTAADTAAAIGTAASGHPLDVTDRGSFEAFLDAAEANHGPIDVLVNNAGVMLLGPFLDEDDRAARRQVDVNFHGVALGMKLVLPRMVGRGRGLIINIASGSSRNPLGGAATYSATKHAVAGLTEAVRSEVRANGVEVAMVLPAPVATDLLSGVPDMPTVPTLRPEQVADAVIGVIHRPRVQTMVPRSLAVTTWFGHLLPRPVKDLARRKLGAEDHYLKAPAAERAAYEERVADQHGRSSEPAAPDEGLTKNPTL
jgi:NADP-dependent 3-hydroxy acid dehydrogenase YdfG